MIRATGPSADLAEKVDPGNELLWRMRLRRLEAEVVRDAILTVSGDLDRKAGGPPVMIQARPDGMVTVNRERPLADPADPFRRSVYLLTRRAYNLSLLTVFDQPLVATNCLDRGASALPLQSLFMINDAFLAEQADHFARRVERCVGADASPEEPVSRAFRIALARDLQRGGNRHMRRAVAPPDRSAVVSAGMIRPRGRAPGPGPALPDALEHQRVLVRGVTLMAQTKRFSDQKSAHLAQHDTTGTSYGRRAVLARRVDGIRNARAGLPARSRTPFGSGRVSDPAGPHRPAASPRVTFPPGPGRSIMLMQVGGPSQIDLFDPKPELRKRDGQVHSQDLETLQPGSESKKLMASPFRFRHHGACGMELSELIPAIGSVADDVCLVRSMYSDNNNHPQATRCLLSGKIFPGRPSVGSWISYALGTENQNLPAYVVLRDPDGYNNGGTTMWESGWLPAIYQGTEIQSRGAAVLDLHPAVKLADGTQRDNLDALARLNEERRKLYPSESVLDARIRNYELAARMQLSAEEVLDIRHETTPTRRLYGLEDPVDGQLRHPLPDGPAPGRVGRSLHTGDGPGQIRRHALGPSREHQARARSPLSASRRAHRGVDTRLETARAAGFDHRPLDGRVRPFADLATRERPRPQPQRV